MANQRDIKRRIATVANTQKITKAMKLVAAAKFAKSVQKVTQSKPYAEGLENTAQSVFSALDLAKREALDSRFQSSKQADRDLYVLFTTDRGLCGPLNSQLFKKIRPICDEAGVSLDFVTVGRKGRSWLKIQGHTPLFAEETVSDSRVHAFSTELSSKLSDLFGGGQYRNVFLVYNEFESALVQVPKIVRFLPFQDFESDGNGEVSQESSVIVEPSVEQVARYLVGALLVSKVQQGILQATASEHGSRMTAMDSASRNASDVKKKLTLKYNRARQAAITKELIEIISGAEAL